ncbi:MAG: GNAT family N-acetyltransferase, partial [Alphaproteobacteria bacterium]
AAAARNMLARVRTQAPDARIDGFTVQPMIKRPGAQELIAGIAEDAVFGPVILFGHGGTAVEVIGDRVVGLPPLNTPLAHEMIERTRVAKLLHGYRDRPGADMAAIVATLRRLSQMACDIAELAEVDINPLLADAQGVLALDARVVLRLRRAGSAPRLAIRPYPRELARVVHLKDGRRFCLRPIRPQDAPALMAMLARAARDDIRMRFFAAIDPADPVMAARLTQLDYDREMALVAVPLDGADRQASEICGVARLAGDPDNEAGELALMVRADMKSQGLGQALMTAILAHARQRGLGRVYSDVLRDNRAMRDLAGRFGFRAAPANGDARVVTLVLDLRAGVVPA